MSSYTRIDVISSLPLEVVEQILSTLDVEDLLRCRLVCQNWDSILVSPSLERLWISTCCHELNLSPEKLQEYHDHLSLHVLAAVALKHRKWLKSLISQVDSIATERACAEENLKANVKSFLGQQRLGMRRVPQVNLSAPTCFLGHNFVFAEYLSPSGEKSLALSHVNPINKSLHSCPSNPMSHAPNLLRNRWVYWALATATYILILIQPDGQWIGYCPLTDKVVLNKKVERSKTLLTSGCVGVACCEKCFMVVTAAAFSDESDIWNLTVLKAGKPKMEEKNLDVYDSRTILIHLKNGEMVVSWKLVPQFTSERVDDFGYCISHSLVCVTNAKTTMYKMNIVSPSDNASANGAFDEVPLIVMEKANTTPIVTPTLCESVQVQSVRLSTDGHLLGVIVNPFQFNVWNIVESCKLVSSADVSTLHAHGLGEPGTHARLIAVGHLYSVVGTFDSKPGGQISIVATQTGELVCQRRSRVQWYVTNGQDYLHLVNEDWLNDIRCFNIPFFVYVNQSVLRSHSSHNLSYVQFTKIKI